MADRIPIEQKAEFIAPLPTPTFEVAGHSTIAYSTIINAPPRVCADTTLHVAKLPEWNPLFHSAEILSQPKESPTVPAALSYITSKPEEYLLPGTTFLAHVCMTVGGKKPTNKANLFVAVVDEVNRENGEKGFRVSWTFRMDSLGVKQERVHEFIEVEGGKTRYVSWETFWGPVSRAITWFMKTKYIDNFQEYLEAFKKRCEEMAVKEQGGLLREAGG